MMERFRYFKMLRLGLAVVDEGQSEARHYAKFGLVGFAVAGV
jgi:hypothetical protein